MSDGPILFYDGVCVFCNRAVQFVLQHDRRRRIRFAALQSAFAADALGRHGRDPADLDTMYLLLDPGTPRERLASRTDAILTVLSEIGWPWSLLSVLRALPRGLRDRAYALFVRNRYRWFGRYDACPIPPPEQRQRFADLSADAEPPRVGSAGSAAWH